MEYTNKIIGNHPLIRNIRRRIRAVAPTNLNVVIYGEAGTEKEIVARDIHAKSMRSQDTFISVNCYQLLEAHRRYITTVFNSARGGTLYLDSIEIFPLPAQRELYRLITNPKEPPLHSKRHKETGVRIIASAISDIVFRQQDFDPHLAGRVQQFSIYIPSIRERKTDIPLLFDYYLTMETGRRRYEEKPAVPERILRAISEYNWNGNITELKNTIEILLDLSSPIGIDPQKEALDADVLPFLALDDPMVFLEQYSYQEAVEKVDAYLIRRALEKTNWNQTRAAKSLNMTEGNIRRKIKKYRIIKPR